MQTLNSTSEGRGEEAAFITILLCAVTVVMVASLLANCVLVARFRKGPQATAKVCERDEFGEDALQEVQRA